MTLRIGGLSSGTDYAGMIEQLMEARRVPIQLQEDKKIEIDYDLGAWADVNSLAEDMSDSLDKLRSYDLWRSMDADSGLESVATATASAASAEQKYTISVTNAARAQSISSNSVDVSTDLIAGGFAAQDDVLVVEGEEITIEAGETLTSLRGKINAASENMEEGRKVRASIVNNHLVLTREDTGSGSIQLSDSTGSVLENLGVINATGSIVNENISGLDANFMVNGITVSRSSNTALTDVVEGLTLNIEGAGTTTIDVKPDREIVKEAIQDFIEKYNTLASKIDEYTQNDLANSAELSLTGELYGDSLVDSIKTTIRKQATMVSTTLDATNASFTYKGETGIMDSLSDIGIWTSGKENQLEIVDESKLDDLLKYEFDNMSQLFRGVYDSDTVSFQGGVASDFYRYASAISSSLTGDIDQRIGTLTDKYDDLSSEVSDMEDALEDYESDLWDQFTFMEDALANMKSQQEYLSAMFASG